MTQIKLQDIVIHNLVEDQLCELCFNIKTFFINIHIRLAVHKVYKQVKILKIYNVYSYLKQDKKKVKN